MPVKPGALRVASEGKVITVARMTVGPDGKTMTITVEDKLRKATISWTADKL